MHKLSQLYGQGRSYVVDKGSNDHPRPLSGHPYLIGQSILKRFVCDRPKTWRLVPFFFFFLLILLT